tara:strand:+ start:418 stop:1995 length:1578 start_codon:yes stop_codon:yes gene_type:complete
MSKHNQKILIFFLFLFSLYCALIIGESWDERFHLIQGKIITSYLFSLGKINTDILYRENYSAIYWSLSFLLTNIFPSKYQIEASHLINLAFSISTIIGIGKISSELFNKKVAKITFLILFFYPIFFGHMAFNSKDTIIAFSHIWITYLLLRYFKKQNLKDKTDKYIICIALCACLGMGIQLVFLGSLLPIILFIIIDLTFYKKFVNKQFNFKKLFFDLLKCFFIFYFILILFWIDTHGNIITLPFEFLIKTFSEDYWTGWPYNLVNGNYYLSENVPKSYLLLNFLYKSPEYILFCYLSFFTLIIFSRKFFIKKFKFFDYKIFLITLILIFPNLILLFIAYPIYDGIRLFLWTVPYICIVPALTIYYFLENSKSFNLKLNRGFLSLLIIYFLFHFFSLTPYQYTYLNIFNGTMENRYKKFENDYWNASIAELIKKSNFSKNDTLKISECGVSSLIAKNYLNNNGYVNVDFVSPDKADYFIMTNRVVKTNEENGELNLTNCFDKFAGENLYQVKRNGVVLSVIRKKE